MSLWLIDLLPVNLILAGTIYNNNNNKEKKDKNFWCLTFKYQYFMFVLSFIKINKKYMFTIPYRKKGSKDASKKFSDGALAQANTRLWESRLVATENARQEFREEAKRLALENESLQKNMHVSERDTIEVITYLKKEDQTKEDLVSIAWSHFRECL